VAREALVVDATVFAIALLGDALGSRAVVPDHTVIIISAVAGAAISGTLVGSTWRRPGVHAVTKSVTDVGEVEGGARAGLRITLSCVVPDSAGPDTVTVSILVAGSLFEAVSQRVLPVGNIDASATAVADEAGSTLVVRVSIG
jgi:hypothetical protein